MLNSIERFKTLLDDLIKYISFEKSLEDFFSKPSSGVQSEFISKTYGPNKTNKKVFNYNSIIISLYGALERLIVELSEEKAEKLNRIIPDYHSLPDKIKSVHLSLSMDLIKKFQREKRYQTSTTLDENTFDSKINEVINNLNSCVVQPKQYFLNTEAFTLHTSNFRFHSINELFINLGVERICERSVSDYKLAKSLHEINNSDINVSSTILQKHLENQLSDLAERRNQVAHGAQTDEVLSLELLNQISEVILNFGNSIGQIIENELNKNEFNGLKLKPVDIKETFPKLKVFGFDFSNKTDNLQSDLVVKKNIYLINNANSNVYKLEILELRKKVNGKIVECKSIASDYKGEFSIKLDLQDHLPNSIYNNSSIYFP